MNKLNLFVCENFCEEFIKTAEFPEFKDIAIKPFPSLCEDRKSKEGTKKALKKSSGRGRKGVVVCSGYCDMINLTENNPSIKIVTSNYCYQHLGNALSLENIGGSGGYVIGLGWLKDWKKHINNMGFDAETAKKFYQEFCHELVFFDLGIDKEARNQLEELSDFLQIPYRIIPVELETLKVLLRRIVSEWRTEELMLSDKGELAEIQLRCAEYAMILEMLCKLSTCITIEEAVEKLKGVFLGIMGARNFNFQKVDEKGDSLENDSNKIVCKIAYKDKTYGIIEAGDFIFPEHKDQYLDLSQRLAPILGVIFSKIHMGD